MTTLLMVALFLSTGLALAAVYLSDDDRFGMA
jgi:hypothetical protein